MIWVCRVTEKEVVFERTYSLFAISSNPFLLPGFHKVSLATLQSLVHLCLELFDLLFEVGDANEVIYVVWVFYIGLSYTLR